MRMARFARSGIVAIGLLVCSIGDGAQTQTSSTLSPDLTKLLQQIKAADTDLLAVSEEDGRFLRVMVASSGATRALEIGGANGYSAIWIGLGLRQTGGHLTTINMTRARESGGREHPPRRPWRCGERRLRRRVQGDSRSRATSTSSFSTRGSATTNAFRYVFPRLRPRGLFLAHNVVNKQSEMPDFLGTIQT
jgi:hypothetical protein